MRLMVVISLAFSLVAGVSVRADEAPHARAYLDQLNDRLAHIEAQMPTISQAADRAAEAIVSGRGSRGNRGFAVRGDAGLANELSNRAGAMLGYDGRAGEAGDVVLYVFGLERRDGPGLRALLVRQLDDAARLKATGSVVVGIGSAQQLRSLGLLNEAEGACDVWLDNGVPLNRKRGLGAGAGVHGAGVDGSGVDEADRDNGGPTGMPMATVLNAAAAWAFQCELFSALTRLDQVPVVRQSFEIDTRKRRWHRYGWQAIHHDRWLDPIPPGQLGQAYLDGLQNVLLDIGTASWGELARTAHRAEASLAVGGEVWLRAGGRYLPYHVGGQLASDPGVFRTLNHDGSDPSLPSPDRLDYVIAVGESEPAGGMAWGEPELLRDAGRGVAWVVNGYNTQRFDLEPGETLIDLWGPYGDGVVKVKNYDTRLGPVTGVVGEAVTWMIAAEVVGKRNDRE